MLILLLKHIHVFGKNFCFLYIYNFFSHNRLSRSGFKCPRCGCNVCSIPSDCPICQLTLISSSHLARSYHHLFPVSPFITETLLEQTNYECLICSRNLLNQSNDGIIMKCEQCLSIFCSGCDFYIHNNLHNCPGCLFK